MADLREVFTILENDTTGEGVKLPARQEGDLITGNEVPVLVAKDSAGNFAHIPLTAQGKIPVDLQSAGTIVRGVNRLDSASVTAGADNDVVTLTLTNNAKYALADFMASCSRFCAWKLVHNDNGTEILLETFVTGSGQYTFSEEPKNLEVTAGATGTQQLKLVGFPRKATDLHGRVSVIELP